MTRLVKDVYQYVLAGIVVCGFFLLIYVLMKAEIPASSRDLLSLVIGALIGSFSTVIGYFFGSSAGSSKKDEIMKDAIKKQ